MSLIKKKKLDINRDTSSCVLNLYRDNTYNIKYTLFSIFLIHNQTLNIWSFVIKSCACIYLTYFSKFSESYQKHIYVYLFIADFIHSPISILYHTFECMPMYIKQLQKLDMLFILLKIPIISYALSYCYLFYNSSYRIIQQAFTIFLMIKLIKSILLKNKIRSFNRTKKTIYVGSLIVSALFPMFFEMIYNDNTTTFFLGLCICLSYILGSSLWVIQFPEKYIKNKLSYIINSHGIMHVCITISHILYYYFIDSTFTTLC